MRQPLEYQNQGQGEGVSLQEGSQCLAPAPGRDEEPQWNLPCAMFLPTQPRASLSIQADLGTVGQGADNGTQNPSQTQGYVMVH